mmetsp:Transcript_17024/g.47817  ORF Transcript_17024/g.47817 Transcript_17024/m.47817 type:complete len:246 (-) Transcript_17024:949-1686(-)
MTSNASTFNKPQSFWRNSKSDWEVPLIYAALSSQVVGAFDGCVDGDMDGIEDGGIDGIDDGGMDGIAVGESVVVDWPLLDFFVPAVALLPLALLSLSSFFPLALFFLVSLFFFSSRALSSSFTTSGKTAPLLPERLEASAADAAADAAVSGVALSSSSSTDTITAAAAASRMVTAVLTGTPLVADRSLSVLKDVRGRPSSFLERSLAIVFAMVSAVAVASIVSSTVLSFMRVAWSSSFELGDAWW